MRTVDRVLQKHAKEMLRYAMADQAFREALAMLDHIQANDFEQSGHLYHAAVTGMVTCYCRLFTEGNGLGALSSDFTTFKKEDGSLQQVHEDLITARNRIHAHLDITYSEEQFQKGDYTLRPKEVVLVLEHTGFGILTNHTVIPRSRLAQVRKLLLLQIARVQKAQARVAITLVKKTKGRLGAYIFNPIN